VPKSWAAVHYFYAHTAVTIAFRIKVLQPSNILIASNYPCL